MYTYQSDNIKIINEFNSVNILDKIALILSIWFGVGLCPLMPGTIGSVGAIPLYFLLNFLNAGFQILSVFTFIIVSIWASHRSQRIMRADDPGLIVIDEVAGFLLTMLLIPFTWTNLMAGFFLFRFFDILKPPPIKKIEQIGRGIGIVFDDLLAGIYAHISLRLIIYLLKAYPSF